MFSKGKVTAVMISCGRYDLLLKTLDSFVSFNTFPIHEVILVEDGPEIPSVVGLYPFPFASRKICTGTRVGQIASVDYAYSLVTTEYIFHLEDDWQFYTPKFIEKSLTILESENRCLQVWLRAVNDTMGHPLCPKVRYAGNVPWQRVEFDYDNDWHGFSFNPGLRRLTDYIDVGGYGIHTRGLANRLGSHEAALSNLYRRRGMFAVILTDESGRGYVRHTGDLRTVRDPCHDIDVSQS